MSPTIVVWLEVGDILHCLHSCALIEVEDHHLPRLGSEPSSFPLFGCVPSAWPLLLAIFDCSAVEADAFVGVKDRTLPDHSFQTAHATEGILSPQWEQPPTKFVSPLLCDAQTSNSPRWEKRCPCSITSFVSAHVTCSLGPIQRVQFLPGYAASLPRASSLLS